MLVVSAKSSLGCAAGCGLVGSCSDHGRIGRALYIAHDVSSVFSKFLSNFGTSFLVAGTMFGDVGG